ncbi:MAG TPA: hypothetical protein VJX67_27585 [Blastocatellia bacterium]|nr:hypothetical protein [Blastocatellia bacterium]
MVKSSDTSHFPAITAGQSFDLGCSNAASVGSTPMTFTVTISQ